MLPLPVVNQPSPWHKRNITENNIQYFSHEYFILLPPCLMSRYNFLFQLAKNDIRDNVLISFPQAWGDILPHPRRATSHVWQGLNVRRGIICAIGPYMGVIMYKPRLVLTRLKDRTVLQMTLFSDATYCGVKRLKVSLTCICYLLQ